MENNDKFAAYDYLDITVSLDRVALYLDAFENFGWKQNEKLRASETLGKSVLHLRRDRSIPNKAELTRLQRQFDACMSDIDRLEASKTSAATAASLGIGILGTAFMAVSVFAVTAAQPIIWLGVLPVIPGIAGWVLPYILHKKIMQKRCATVEPLIESKYDELYAVCEKGKQLL